MSYLISNLDPLSSLMHTEQLSLCPQCSGMIQSFYENTKNQENYFFSFCLIIEKKKPPISFSQHNFDTNQMMKKSVHWTVEYIWFLCNPGSLSLQSSSSRLAAVKITTYFLCMSRKELEVQLLYIYTECPTKSLCFTR